MAAMGIAPPHSKPQPKGVIPGPSPVRDVGVITKSDDRPKEQMTCILHSYPAGFKCAVRMSALELHILSSRRAASTYLDLIIENASKLGIHLPTRGGAR